MNYEHYIELFKVMERFDTGEIKTTESLGHMWVTDEYRDNPPIDFICAAASDEFSQSNMTIRKAKS